MKMSLSQLEDVIFGVDEIPPSPEKTEFLKKVRKEGIMNTLWCLHLTNEFLITSHHSILTELIAIQEVLKKVNSENTTT